MKTNIREAVLSDVPVLVQLSEQLGYSMSAELLEKNLLFLLESKVDAVFVAENEFVTGWIHVFKAVRIESKPFAEIGGLVVDENQRGQGTGSLLIDAVMKWASENQLSELRVRTNVVREETLVYYQNRGFELSKKQNILLRREGIE